MENIYEDLMAGLDEVESYMIGKPEGYEVHGRADVDVTKTPEKEQEIRNA